MSDAIKSKSVSLADIFDPYVAGTTKARSSGIADGGTDTSDIYANIIYGSAAAATGIASESADLNTLYAAKGTASYKLPIDGNAYNATGISSGVMPIKPATGRVSVQVGGGQYNIQTYEIGNGGSAVITNYTYSIPSGMDYYRLVFSDVSVGAGGSTITPSGSWGANPASLTTEGQVSTTNNTNNGTRQTSATVSLYFGATSGTPVFSATFSIVGETDISA